MKRGFSSFRTGRWVQFYLYGVRKWVPICVDIAFPRLFSILSVLGKVSNQWRTKDNEGPLENEHSIIC